MAYENIQEEARIASFKLQDIKIPVAGDPIENSEQDRNNPQSLTS
jgi:hypothetical protein